MLTVKEIAMLTSLSVSQVRRYVQGGEMPHIRNGRAVMVSPEQFRVFFEFWSQGTESVENYLGRRTSESPEIQAIADKILQPS